MFYGKPNAGLLCVDRFKSPPRFRVAIFSELRMTVTATRSKVSLLGVDSLRGS